MPPHLLVLSPTSRANVTPVVVPRLRHQDHVLSVVLPSLHRTHPPLFLRHPHRYLLRLQPNPRVTPPRALNLEDRPPRLPPTVLMLNPMPLSSPNLNHPRVLMLPLAQLPLLRPTHALAPPIVPRPALVPALFVISSRTSAPCWSGLTSPSVMSSRQSFYT